MRHAVVIDAVRTPIGRAHAEKGIYRDVRADDLSADLMRALIERAGVPASAVEDIQWGCVKQQGEQGYDVARMAALIAGLPIEVGGVTVNRNCGSSLQAINSAAARASPPTPRTCRSPAASSTCTTSRWRPASTPARACGITTAPPP